MTGHTRPTAVLVALAVDGLDGERKAARIAALARVSEKVDDAADRSLIATLLLAVLRDDLPEVRAARVALIEFDLATAEVLGMEKVYLDASGRVLGGLRLVAAAAHEGDVETLEDLAADEDHPRIAKSARRRLQRLLRSTDPRP